MDAIINALHQIKNWLDVELFTVGNSGVTLWKLLYLVLVLFVLFYGSAKVKNWIVNRLMARSSTDIGVRQSVGSVTRYTVLTIGIIIIVQTAGIDLSALTILAGALGVGIGFGLQGITNNIVSGIIILLERPIKVGDRVQVGEITGDVIKISLRATVIVTNDNISIIVPNADFVSSNVINWSHVDRNVRVHIPVGVSYSSDPDLVKRVLLEVANEHEGVLKEPMPDVVFLEFGDSSLNFELRVWTQAYITRPFVLRSDLNFVIKRKFKENGIEIPFPQRDLHIRDGMPPLKSS